ncbi:MAG: hypothetical protein IJQ58_02000 [Synergistaceae bacterium]|nr:hypothetical protein [Synergistaceae bacterium]
MPSRHAHATIPHSNSLATITRPTRPHAMPANMHARQFHTQTAPQQSHALHALTTCPPICTLGNLIRKQPRNNLTPYTPSHHASPKNTPGNPTHKQPRNNPTPYTPSRHVRQYAHPAISYANRPAKFHALHALTTCQPKNTRQSNTQTHRKNSMPYTPSHHARQKSHMPTHITSMQAIFSLIMI